MRDDKQTTSEDRATQLLICEALSLATTRERKNRLTSEFVVVALTSKAPKCLIQEFQQMAFNIVRG